MERASWATLTLSGVDDHGRALIATTRVVIVDYPDRRTLLVAWWPQWAVRVGGWSSCPN